MKVQDLYETPMMIGDNDFDPVIDGFDLTDPSENTEAYEKIINSKDSNLIQKHTDKGSKYLYTYGSKIVLLDTLSKSVDYYVKVEKGKFKITGQYVTQVEVWRTTDSPVYDVVRTVFFDHILKSHDTVLSDSLQTNDGRRLWVNLVGYAFDEGKYVYVVDLNTGTLHSIKNSNDYRNRIQNFYSTQKKSAYVRIMISNKKVD